MKTCKINNGCNKYLAKGYCKRHYEQLQRYGKVLKRTIRDLNEIIDCGDYAEIVLYNNKHQETARALIDSEDVERVKGFKWCLASKYITTSRKKKTVFLHHIIFGYPPNNLEIDHVNHNTFDNRKRNIRFVTRSQNNINRKFRGIYLNKSSNKWISRIMINSKRIHLGCFVKEQDALKARRKAEIKYFGEYRYKI